jgi:hypothetical protein
MAKRKKIKLNKKQKKQLEYVVVSVFLFLAFFFWNSFFIYPIKLFVVLTHEMSHGLAAILTGGHLDSILITTSLGGESRTIEGNKFIIASSGYLGSLLFGVALFVSGHKEKFRKTTSILLAVLLILFAANYLEGNLGKISSVFFATVFIVLPIYFSEMINLYFFKLLGLISMFYVAIDIKEDILTNVYRPSDAQFIASLTSVSATVWGILWLTISILTIFILLRWSFKNDF